MKYTHKLAILDTQDPPPVVFVVSEPNEHEAVWVDIGDCNPENEAPALQYIHKKHIKITPHPIVYLEHPDTRKKVPMQLLIADDWGLYFVDKNNRIYGFNTELWWFWMHYRNQKVPVTCMVPYAQHGIPREIMGFPSSDSGQLFSTHQMDLNEWNSGCVHPIKRSNLWLLNAEDYSWETIVEEDYEL